MWTTLLTLRCMHKARQAQVGSQKPFDADQHAHEHTQSWQSPVSAASKSFAATAGAEL
jgi:hypothetical protein